MLFPFASVVILAVRQCSFRFEESVFAYSDTDFVANSKPNLVSETCSLYMIYNIMLLILVSVDIIVVSAKGRCATYFHPEPYASFNIGANQPITFLVFAEVVTI